MDPIFNCNFGSEFLLSRIPLLHGKTEVNRRIHVLSYLFQNIDSSTLTIVHILCFDQIKKTYHNLPFLQPLKLQYIE